MFVIVLYVESQKYCIFKINNNKGNLLTIVVLCILNRKGHILFNQHFLFSLDVCTTASFYIISGTIYSFKVFTYLRKCEHGRPLICITSNFHS